jgi:hypothetical protein
MPLRLLSVIVTWYPMLIATIFFMRRDKESLKDIGFSKENIPLQILFGAVVAIGSLLVFIVLPALFGIQMGYVGSLDIFSNLIEFVCIILGVALVEEIVFRGHLYKKLLDVNNSKWFAIIISSVLFGLFHFLGGNIIQIVVTAIMGLYWCICREKIKHCTLLSLIIAHALHNAIHPIITALLF